DGGTVQILAVKSVDAVKADHLHIVRDAHPQGIQPLADLVAQAVGAAENAIVGKSAVSGVLDQKGLKGREPGLVFQEQGVERDTLGLTGGFKAGAALIGLVGKARALPQKQ